MVGRIGRILSQISGSVAVSDAEPDELITRKLMAEARAVFDPSRYSAKDSGEFAVDLAIEVAAEFGLLQSVQVVKALSDCLEALVVGSALFPPEVEWDYVDHDGEEGIRLRRYLRRHISFHRNFETNDQRFRLGIRLFCAALFEHVPTLPEHEQDTARGFGIRLGDLLSDFEGALGELVRAPFHPDLEGSGLFEDLRHTLLGNILVASGRDRHDIPSSARQLRMPKDFSGSREAAQHAYLEFTPFLRLLETPVPFALPREARFEHTHIVGGTGHGKTQLLSHLILQDIVDIIQGQRKSVVVIDSQGDLIGKLSSMLLFDPRLPHRIADKLVIIDPHDIDHPTALNIFTVNEERMRKYGPVERERVFNGAVELYEHFFSGLLGAELTQKQGVAFSYLARLMLELPDATIFTLRDLMDEPERFKDDIARLSGSTRMFFEREFLSRSFAQTRRQISRRLWGILAIPAFERMFGQTEHKVDLFDLLNEGKIILINTSQALLKKEGSAIFGRFFLAAIAQAVGERAVLPHAKRTDTIVYLDEAHEYADESLESLLNQGRKYRTGVVIAHQFLDQLSAQTRQTLLANASVKIVGGMSHKDNQAFAREMGTDIDTLAALRKRESSTEFALWIKHVLPQAVRMQVPFGLLESAKRLDDEGAQALRAQNRRLYGASAPPALPGAEVPSILAPAQISEGRGGSQHRELQQVIKGIGHDLGFGAQIEAPCTESDGAMDVLLRGERTTIAAEVSISTSPEHELQNLRKCLAEPVDLILCVSPDDTHRLTIQNLCLETLPPAQAKRIKYLHPNLLAEYLAQFDERETTLIRGYEVVVRTVPSDPEDVAYRESRIRRIIEARGLG